MKKKHWCECKSYNRPEDTGEVDSVLLDPNEYFDFANSVKLVPVDACIADLVLKLWEANILTKGSCCGHNGILPRSIILDNWRDAERAHKVIKGKIELVAWKLITV